MLKKNLEEYSSKFKHISKNQLERIQDYIDNSNFSEKDLKKFEKEYVRINNIETEILKMIFYIIPESTPRPRMNFSHGNFYVKNARSNNDFVKILMDKEKFLKEYFIYTPCYFQCDMYFPIPTNMSKSDTLLAELGIIRPCNNKDWDNLGKTYSDMIQKWLLLNDSLVVSGTSKKFYSLKPRVEIELEYLTEYDCKFNQKQIENTKVYKREFDIDKV